MNGKRDGCFLSPMKTKESMRKESPQTKESHRPPTILLKELKTSNNKWKKIESIGKPQKNSDTCTT